MTFDLSSITDSLLNLVSSQWSTAPIWTELGAGGFKAPTPIPTFSGLAPDQANTQSGPQLGLYLYHIETNHAAESLFWQPQLADPSVTGQPVRFIPQALDAFYLLYSYSEGNWIEEQQLMSVALRVFHTQPIVRSPTGVSPAWELTLTPEHRSYDELSRLWQATTAPLRMSLVYRAAVVFLEPDQIAPDPNLVEQVNLTVNPVELDPSETPTLLTTTRQLSYVAPGGTTVTATSSPATVTQGQTLTLIAKNLGGADFSDVYLLAANGDELDVTSWLVPSEATPTSWALKLPDPTPPPVQPVPPPGIYQLRVGSGTVGAIGSFRSPSITVAVAPWVDPSMGPTLTPGTTHTVEAGGLIPSQTTVWVGTVQLQQISSSSPSEGQIYIDPTGSSLTFNPPAGTPGTLQPLAIQVDQIPADPALWVQF
jgi:hypothetical protein